jgi:hypothetical protein
VVGSIPINRVAHDSLFSKAESLIYVKSAIIVHENIQIKTVRPVLTKCPVSYLGEKSFARPLIGRANDNPLYLDGAVFGKQAAEDGEGSNVSLLIFCHEIAGIRIGQGFKVFIRWPGTNERAEVWQRLQPINLSNIGSYGGSEHHGERLTGLLF